MGGHGHDHYSRLEVREAGSPGTKAQKKGPRNGPDPRGAGNLNRFRERLDGDCKKFLLKAAARFRAAASL